MRTLLIAAAGAALLCASGCDFRETEPEPEGDTKRGLHSKGHLVASFSFDRESLDPQKWNNTADKGGWVIEDGWVHTDGTHNQALWLKEPLPEKVRIEFDARSESPDGDIKVEVFGDGERHESGYILIFGGWQNTVNTIARLDEHAKNGEGRIVGATDKKVEKGRSYHMAIVRTDRSLRWFVDGELFLEFDDEEPLRGEGHRYFAFNSWEVPLYFDNLTIYELE